MKTFHMWVYHFKNITAESLSDWFSVAMSDATIKRQPIVLWFLVANT